MKRGMVAGAACAAMLAAGATSASAAVERTVYRCEGTGAWQVSINLSGQSTAQRTISAPAGACKQVRAAVADDGNFAVFSFDSSDFNGPATFNLIGAGVTGVSAFVGVATEGPALRGPIAIAGDSLDATLSAPDATPSRVTEVHTGDGSCGANCYRTKAVWIGTYGG